MRKWEEVRKKDNEKDEKIYNIKKEKMRERMRKCLWERRIEEKCKNCFEIIGIGIQEHKCLIEGEFRRKVNEKYKNKEERKKLNEWQWGLEFKAVLVKADVTGCLVFKLKYTALQ